MIFQNVTVQAIVCRAHETERPELKLSGTAAQPTRLMESQDPEGAWTMRFSLPPGTYAMDVSVPYHPGTPGCVYLTRYFTPGDMEGPKFGSVRIDLRNTRQLTKIQRDVTVGDLTPR
jgi:hypothetical protein